MDSLGAVELRNAIASSFGVSLPATAAFDHPTLGHMAAFIVKSRHQAEPFSATKWPALPSTDMSHVDVSARLRTVVGSILGAYVADAQPLMEVRQFSSWLSAVVLCQHFPNTQKHCHDVTIDLT